MRPGPRSRAASEQPAGDARQLLFSTISHAVTYQMMGSPATTAHGEHTQRQSGSDRSDCGSNDGRGSHQMIQCLTPERMQGLGPDNSSQCTRVQQPTSVSQHGTRQPPNSSRQFFQPNHLVKRSPHAMVNVSKHRHTRAPSRLRARQHHDQQCAAAFHKRWWLPMAGRISSHCSANNIVATLDRHMNADSMGPPMTSLRSTTQEASGWSLRQYFTRLQRFTQPAAHIIAVRPKSVKSPTRNNITVEWLWLASHRASSSSGSHRIQRNSIHADHITEYSTRLIARFCQPTKDLDHLALGSHQSSE
ncbi:hypothetical protein HPP92_013234 [Vanilla planifolia]|uniref:Uncharacterized protein n=1 Tax=Vanilla planifolia TaxID=51239 RepID=A0A835UWG8_VANPL|nr:hypothetical protein HPP92_013234 [Vanilla planifolia]